MTCFRTLYTSMSTSAREPGVVKVATLQWVLGV
jgi:hypothetical protein